MPSHILVSFENFINFQLMLNYIMYDLTRITIPISDVRFSRLKCNMFSPPKCTFLSVFFFFFTPCMIYEHFFVFSSGPSGNYNASRNSLIALKRNASFRVLVAKPPPSRQSTESPFNLTLRETVWRDLPRISAGGRFVWRESERERGGR